MVGKAISKILFEQADEKTEGPEDYNFRGLSFEDCVVLDTMVRSKNFAKVLKSMKAKIDPHTIMLFDLINRVDALDTKATLEDCLDYACAVMQITGLPDSRPDIDIKNKAAKAIVDAVLQSITGLDSALIDKIKTPDDAEAAAFIGAYVDAKRGEYEFKKDIRTTAELLAEKNSIADVPGILLKFDDRKTALKYFEKNKKNLSAEDYRSKSRLHGLEKDVESEVFSLLEASKLNVDYVSELSELLASRTLNSGLLDKLDSALGKVSNPELLYLLEPQDTKRAIKLLERAVGLKEDARYYMRLGALYVRASHSINAGNSFANAVRLNPDLLNDAMEEVQSAKIQAEFVLGLADLGLDIGVVVGACSKQKQVEVFASYLNNNIIFSYFIKEIKNFKGILPQIEKNLSAQLSAEECETLASNVLSQGMDDVASRFYDRAINISPSVNAYMAKHNINIKNKNNLEAFKCLSNALKIYQEIPHGRVEVRQGLHYIKLLDQAEAEIIASGGQALFVGTLLDSLSDKTFKNNNLLLCVSLANQLKSEAEIIKCYEKFNSIIEDSDLKLLRWDKEFLTVANYLEKGKNFDGAIRFLDEMLRRDNGAHDARIKKEGILLAQGKVSESLELILDGLPLLKPKDEENKARYVNIICGRVQSGAYANKELELLLAKYIKTTILDNSVLRIIDSAKTHSIRGNCDYAKFISQAYEHIIPHCDPSVHATYCADKADVEFPFDAKKSLESLVEAVEHNHNYLERLIEKGYGLQAIRGVLPGIIKHMPHGANVNKSREFVALGNKFKEEAKKANENSIQWRNNIESVIMCFEEAKLHQPDAEIYNALGELYKSMSDNSKALNAFISAAEISKNYSTLEGFCGSLFSSQRYVDAAKGYDFILSRMSSERVLLNAGKCKVELKDNAKAIEYFDGILQIGNAAPAMRNEALLWKSTALESLGYASGALDAINRAGANAGNIFYSRKMDLELKLGKTDDVVQTLRAAPSELKQQYKTRVAYKLAQKSYEKLSSGDSNAAASLSDKSLEIENNWLACYVKGLHGEKSLDFVAAVRSYKQAIMLAPTNRLGKITADALERCALKAYEYNNTDVVSAGIVPGKSNCLIGCYTDKHGRSSTRLGAIDTILSFSVR